MEVECGGGVGVRRWRRDMWKLLQLLAVQLVAFRCISSGVQCVRRARSFTTAAQPANGNGTTMVWWRGNVERFNGATIRCQRWEGEEGGERQLRGVGGIISLLEGLVRSHATASAYDQGISINQTIAVALFCFDCALHCFALTVH